MAIDFGLALTPGPLKDNIAGWMQMYDVVLPRFDGHFKSLWMTDHLFWHDWPTYETFTVLTYLAAQWPNFDVGNSVLGQSYRNPALTAKISTTLQILSGGRLILGIGAGWKEDEYRGYGFDFPRAGIRMEQLDEALTLIKRLYSEPGPHTFHGQYYHIDAAYCEPRPTPPPLIMVGGGGSKTMGLAVKHADWWNISDTQVDPYREKLAVLEQHCEQQGRDPASLRRTWFGRLAVGKTEAAARELARTHGREHYDGWSADSALLGTPAQIVEQIQAFNALGCDYFMIEILDLPDEDITGMVLEDVVAKVR